MPSSAAVPSLAGAAAGSVESASRLGKLDRAGGTAHNRLSRSQEPAHQVRRETSLAPIIDPFARVSELLIRAPCIPHARDCVWMGFSHSGGRAGKPARVTFE